MTPLYAHVRSTSKPCHKHEESQASIAARIKRTRPRALQRVSRSCARRVDDASEREGQVRHHKRPLRHLCGPANIRTLNRVALTSSRSSNRVPASRSGWQGRTGKVHRKGRCQAKNAEAFVTAEEGVVVDAVGDMREVGRGGCVAGGGRRDEMDSTLMEANREVKRDQ